MGKIRRPHSFFLLLGLFSTLLFSDPPEPKLKSCAAAITNFIPDEVSDEILLAKIRAAKSGDQAAFTSLMLAYKSNLIGVAYNILSNHADAEDVYQDVALRAWENINTFDDKNSGNSLKSWLMQVARNRALDVLRYRDLRGYRDNIGEDPDSPTKQEPIDDKAMRPDDFAHFMTIEPSFQWALDQLSSKEKEAILLSMKFDSLTHEELAEKMHPPVKGNYFAQLVFTARNRMKELLNGRDFEPQLDQTKAAQREKRKAEKKKKN